MVTAGESNVGPVCTCLSLPDSIAQLCSFAVWQVENGCNQRSSGEAMTIAEPESPHPHRRLNRLRHEVPIQELPVV